MRRCHRRRRRLRRHRCGLFVAKVVERVDEFLAQTECGESLDGWFGLRLCGGLGLGLGLGLCGGLWLCGVSWFGLGLGNWCGLYFTGLGGCGGFVSCGICRVGGFGRGLIGRSVGSFGPFEASHNCVDVIVVDVVCVDIVHVDGNEVVIADFVERLVSGLIGLV